MKKYKLVDNSANKVQHEKFLTSYGEYDKMVNKPVHIEEWLKSNEFRLTVQWIPEIEEVEFVEIEPEKVTVTKEVKVVTKRKPRAKKK